MMSTIVLGSSSGLRSTSARRGIAARSSARTVFSEPFPARPMGVRMASTITASGISGALLGRGPSLAWARGPSAYAVIAPQRDQVAPQVLARGLHLARKARAQLAHQALVGALLAAVGHATKGRGDGLAAHARRRHG